MKWGITALVVCCAAVAASATTRRMQLSVPTRQRDEVKTGMMQKMEAAPKSKRPSLYMRTASANSKRNEAQMRLPNMQNIQRKEEAAGVRQLSIPRGRPRKRLQLSVPRKVPGMSENADAQKPNIHAHAKVGPGQKAPQLTVPGGSKEAMNQKEGGGLQLSVPSLRMGNQRKKPKFRLRVPQSPEMVEKVAAEGRTGQKRRHGIQLSVPRQDVRQAAKKMGPKLRVPSLGTKTTSQRRSDAGLPTIGNLKKGRRSRRSPADEDFVVEDHVVKILNDDGDEATKEQRSALEVEDVPVTAEAEADAEADAEAVKPKTRIEKNKETIRGRVKEVIGNVVSSMERMVEEKNLLEEDLKRLMALPVREEDLQDRIHAKLERIYEKLEEQVEDRAKLTEYMDEEIQWDDELSRRMDEELDAYEMERIRSEVEWRREQQKADKLIRANFDGESQVEEEEKSLLSMLEERIRELNELRNNPKHRYDYEDDYY